MRVGDEVMIGCDVREGKWNSYVGVYGDVESFVVVPVVDDNSGEFNK